MTHWEEPKDNDKKDDDAPCWYYNRARSTDIEQTSYVLLRIPSNTYEVCSISVERGTEDAVTLSPPIYRWLSMQRNGLGGWSSTQVSILI